jgi:hypothetical protein
MGTPEATMGRWSGMRRGRELELSLFGAGPSPEDPAYRKNLAEILSADTLRVSEKIKTGETIPGPQKSKAFGELHRRKNKLVKLISEHQESDFDPENPPKDFLRELRINLIEGLGLPDEETDRIKAYSAIGTPLDTIAGIDSFFIIREKEGEYCITIDGSARQKNPDEIKAHIFVKDEPPDPNEDWDGYIKTINLYTAKIMDKLNELRTKRETLDKTLN